jgi:hypothetical protein
MSVYYTYLISSLPMLSFSAKLPFSLEDFFARCDNLVPRAEIELLRKLAGSQEYLFLSPGPETLKRWISFEVALRNELVRARAGRKRIDPLKFIRREDAPSASISHVAMAAYRSVSILEGEKILDQARWEFLEGLGFEHYFDFDYLLIYALKLKILERWDKIQKADKDQLLNAAVSN